MDKQSSKSLRHLVLKGKNKSVTFQENIKKKQQTFATLNAFNEKDEMTATKT